MGVDKIKISGLEKSIINIAIGKENSRLYLMKYWIIFIIELDFFCESCDAIGNIACKRTVGTKRIGVVSTIDKLKIPVTDGLCKIFNMIYLPEKKTYQINVVTNPGKEYFNKRRSIGCL